MNTENLVDAMSFIDECYIVEAQTEYKASKRGKLINIRELLAYSKKARLLAIAASAACVCLVVLLTLPRLIGSLSPVPPEAPSDITPPSDIEPSDPPKPPEATEPGFNGIDNETVKLHIGAHSADRTQEIEILELGGGRIRFKYKKAVPCETHVYLYLSDPSLPYGHLAVATTASEYRPAQNETLKHGAPVIYVDGKYHYDKLPQDAGEYEVVIDFSALCGRDTELSEISLTGFERIPIGKLKDEHSQATASKETFSHLGDGDNISLKLLLSTNKCSMLTQTQRTAQECSFQISLCSHKPIALHQNTVFKFLYVRTAPLSNPPVHQ